MLNWRRDPDYERRMNALAIKIQQTKHETEQIEKAILRVRKEREQLRSESEQIRSEAEQIKSETEQIEQETEQLRQQNAKGRQLLASMHALCYPDASSSTHPPATATDSAPFSP
jgi:septal ring factor EnvC (AmiA/AmiB activator)